MVAAGDRIVATAGVGVAVGRLDHRLHPEAPASATAAMPKTIAFSGVTCAAGSGRLRVRDMSRSMSRSRYWLMAFAEPAASVPIRSPRCTV